MERFADSRLEEIFNYRNCGELPRELCGRAHRMSRLLSAARSLATVTLFAKPVRQADGSFSVQVHNRWHIRFDWDAKVGAYAMKLERR